MAELTAQETPVFVASMDDEVESQNNRILHLVLIVLSAVIMICLLIAISIYCFKKYSKSEEAPAPEAKEQPEIELPDTERGLKQ